MKKYARQTERWIQLGHSHSCRLTAHVHRAMGRLRATKSHKPHQEQTQTMNLIILKFYIHKIGECDKGGTILTEI